MFKKIYILLISILFFSCSHKKQITYLNDLKKGNLNKIDFYNDNKIEVGDILKIDINTVIPEASTPYNNLDDIKSTINNDLLILSGYEVYKDSTINYPVLGEIDVVGLSEKKLAFKIKNLLVIGGHYNPHVKSKKINSKFTVIGEVKNPGTFTH